jgi:hypothetical protein
MPNSIPILNVEDALDRQALLQAHNWRCRYCGEALSLRELEIDHIIPTHLREKSEELAKCLTLFGLSSDYDLNSIDNLLPTHGHCNREKRGVLRDEAFLRHFRELAREASPRWTANRERIAKNRRADADVAAVANHMSEGTVTLQAVADVATCRQPFDPTDDIQRDDFIRMSEPQVRIECELPTESRPAGRALITFHSVTLRGAQIEASHEVLTRELFRGLCAPAHPRWRRFLMKSRKTKAIYHLQIGGVSVQLEPDEVLQFCRLLDHLYPVYAQAFHRAEVTFAGLGSPLKSPGSYEIASVPLAVWQQMEAFIRHHDLAHGDSEWHIFDAPAWVWLKVIKRTAERWEYLCFLDVVVKCPSADPRIWPRNSVSLRWIASENYPSADRHASGWCWSVKECEAFMFDRFIPKVLSTSWLNPPILVSELRDIHIHRSSGHNIVTTADVASPDKAAQTLEKIQPLYSREHDQFVGPEVVAGVFQFLVLLLQHHQLPSYSVDYMGPNLRCTGAEDKSALITQANALLRRARRTLDSKAEPVATGATMDYALRCVLEALRKGEADELVRRQWTDWIKFLEPVITDYNDRNYLIRMRAEDFNDD